MTIASEQLWETFSAPLYQFIRNRVPDAHIAEDILQDVFLKIHTHIDTLRTPDRLTSWIYQLTRNAIADYYRSRRPTISHAGCGMLGLASVLAHTSTPCFSKLY